MVSQINRCCMGALARFMTNATLPLGLPRGVGHGVTDEITLGGGAGCPRATKHIAMLSCLGCSEDILERLSMSYEVSWHAA